jgi:hypothetical protein
MWYVVSFPSFCPFVIGHLQICCIIWCLMLSLQAQH